MTCRGYLHVRHEETEPHSSGITSQGRSARRNGRGSHASLSNSSPLLPAVQPGGVTARRVRARTPEGIQADDRDLKLTRGSSPGPTNPFQTTVGPRVTPWPSLPCTTLTCYNVRLAPTFKQSPGVYTLGKSIICSLESAHMCALPNRLMSLRPAPSPKVGVDPRGPAKRYTLGSILCPPHCTVSPG